MDGSATLVSFTRCPGTSWRLMAPLRIRTDSAAPTCMAFRHLRRSAISSRVQDTS